MIYNDITFLIPSMRGGGAEKVTMLLANELVSRGWKVTFLMSGIEGPYLKHLDPAINLIKLRHPKISRNIWQIKKYLEHKKPSIFYSSMNYVNIIASLSFLISKTSAQLILSEHNDIIQVLKNSPRPLRLFMSLGIKHLYKRAAAIVCVSKGVESSLQKQYPKIKNTVQIYNPIEQFSLVAPPIHAALDKSTKNLISIGRFSEQKNQKFLLKAFAGLKTRFPKGYLKLTILGEGVLRKELELLIEELGLKDEVSLPGFKAPRDYLLNSDLFILPSKREGFGNVIVEALSAGLPVVSTDCPSGPAEILSNSKYGKLVAIDDENALTETMYELLIHPEKAGTVEDRKKRAADFSVQKITDQYEKLFLTI